MVEEKGNNNTFEYFVPSNMEGPNDEFVKSALKLQEFFMRRISEIAAIHKDKLDKLYNNEI